jgi:hypothetical protein
MVVQKIELSFDNETFIDVTAHSSAVIEPSLRAGQTSFLYILFPNELDTKILDELDYYVCLTMTNEEEILLQTRVTNKKVLRKAKFITFGFYEDGLLTRANHQVAKRIDVQLFVRSFENLNRLKGNI